VRSIASPILVIFGRGAPPQAYMHIAPGKKEKLGQRPIQISRGTDRQTGQTHGTGRRCDSI